VLDGAQIDPREVAWVHSVQTGDPLLFATGVLGFLLPGSDNPHRKPQLEAWQVVALKKFRKAWRNRFDAKGRISIRSGHGVGKTCYLSVCILFVLLCSGPDTKIPVVANSENQLRDGLWPELQKWIGHLPPSLKAAVEWQKERVVIKEYPEEAFAVARTATKHRPEALQGIHAKTVLAVFEEASGIPEETIEAGAGTLSTPGAIAICAGNPTRTTGFFYKTHTALRDMWDCMVVSSEDVPRARGHIEDIIALYGRASNKYRVRVLGEFPTQEDQTVISLEKVIAARGRDVSPQAVWPVWGLDPGRFGDDPSALVVRQGNILLSHYTREWHGLDGTQLAGRVIALYNETPAHEKPREIVVDEIGIGTSVFDQLRLPGSPVREITRGCNVAEAAAISETEYRLRDELWFRGRAWFEQLNCRIEPTPHHPEITKLIEKMVGELTAATYDYTILGKRLVISKKDMRKAGIPSPNLADAFLLSLAAGIYPRNTYERSRRRDSDGTTWAAA
jgi:phage terminase large subunit